METKYLICPVAKPRMTQRDKRKARECVKNTLDLKINASRTLSDKPNEII